MIWIEGDLQVEKAAQTGVRSDKSEVPAQTEVGSDQNERNPLNQGSEVIPKVRFPLKQRPVIKGEEPAQTEVRSDQKVRFPLKQRSEVIQSRRTRSNRGQK